MSRPIRIFVLNAPEEVNGITWWRMFRPLQHIYFKYYPNIEIIHNATGMIYPHHFLYTDLALCYRPCEPNHVQAMKMAKDAGVQIVSDFDDNILKVPIGHSVWREYRGKESFIQACIAMSNQIWVSTPALKEQFQHPNTVVVPNAIFESDLPAEYPENDGVVLWRGSELHREDLGGNFPYEYSRMLDKIKKFLWVGYMPTWAAIEKKADIEYETNWVSTNQWFQYLKSQRLLAISKPLMNCEFNDSKSNISWLEATQAGAVCIGSYAGKPGWEYCLKELPKNKEAHRQAWEKSREAIIRNYNLEQWNEIRYREILRTANGNA